MKVNILIIVGLLLNSSLILFNRYAKHIPDRIYLPLLIFGIALMVTGAILSRC